MKISFEDIQVCMIVKDEESMLANALAPLVDMFPAFAVLDQSSMDRTLEIAKHMLGEKLILISRERDYVTRNGFSAARNLVSAEGTLSWLLHIDADERLRTTSDVFVEPSPSIGERDISFAAVTRRNLAGLDSSQNLSDTALAAVDTSSIEMHTRLYRRDAGLRWHSFIHEELWDKTARLTYDVPRSNLVFDHLSGLKAETNKEAKEDLYSWMLLEGLTRTGTEEDLSAYARHYALDALDYHRSRAVRYAKAHELQLTADSVLDGNKKC